MGPYIFWGLKPCFSCLGLSCPYVQWQAWESVRLCFTFISYAKVTNPWSSLQICDELRLLGHLLILILYVCNDCEMMYIFLLLFYLSACWERNSFYNYLFPWCHLIWLEQRCPFINSRVVCCVLSYMWILCRSASQSLSLAMQLQAKSKVIFIFV